MNNYRTTYHVPTHPDAVRAIWLARRLQGAPSDVITRALSLSEVPRRLFVLASELQAYQAGQIIDITT